MDQDQQKLENIGPIRTAVTWSWKVDGPESEQATKRSPENPDSELFLE